MFLDKQSRDKIIAYQQSLKIIGALSNLFSDNKDPFIQYRIAENLFCRSFDAKNLSRGDSSADASKDGLGIGIKTFLEKNGSTMQKIAEFNSEHHLFSNIGSKGKVLKVSELRNKRIDATKRIFNLKEMIYHCITRKEGAIQVYEIPMEYIDVSNISDIQEKGNTITFKDSLNEYSFNISKSTLYMRFHSTGIILDFPVEILEDPFEILNQKFQVVKSDKRFSPIREMEHIFLPLYSDRQGEKIVPLKSGLNQWNAEGRPRDSAEIYVRIPAWIHRSFPKFFPGRDIPFTLILPNGKNMIAKVCQENSKALMSNPNSSLGEWLLYDVLGLDERELLTYALLEEIGLDSVVIYKTAGDKYEIDFSRLDSFETFRSSHASTS